MSKIPHDRILDAYRAKCPDGWPSGPNDGYFFEHLCDHLAKAGRLDELADLLQDLNWLERKNSLGLTFDLPSDYSVAFDALASEPSTTDSVSVAQGENERSETLMILKLLDEALRRDIHFIARHSHEYPQGLFQCMWNHAWWYDCPEATKYYSGGRTPSGSKKQLLSGLLLRWRKEKEESSPGFPWIRALRPPPVQLGTHLKFTLSGHSEWVSCAAFSMNGMQIATGSSDRTVRVWDTTSGAQLACLEGHHDAITSVVFSPDGRRIVSGSYDHTVRVWDAASNVQLACLEGHSAIVGGVAFSPYGSRIASVAEDETMRVWDSVNYAEVMCFEGHLGMAVCDVVEFSPDGTRIADLGHYGVRVWDTENGVQLACLDGHTDIVKTMKKFQNLFCMC